MTCRQPATPPPLEEKDLLQNLHDPPPNPTGEETSLLSAFVGGFILGIVTCVIVVACAVAGVPLHGKGDGDLLR